MKKVGKWFLPDEDKHFEEYFKSSGSDEYQPVHRNRALRHCNDFRTALDIGAHVGLWARGLCDVFEDVICFEPYAPFAKIIRENAPHAEIWCCALGDQPGYMALEVVSENTGMTHLIKGSTGNIEVKTLDSLEFQNVDFMKIDVEGFELEVIKGAKETIDKWSPVIIVEQKEKYADPENGPRAAVKFLIHEMGYQPVEKVVDDWIMKRP